MRGLMVVCLLGLGVVLGLVTDSSAESTWCSGLPDSIFCFDFDRLCTSPPPYPEVCPAGSTKLHGMHDPWAYTSLNYNTGLRCGSDMTTEEVPSDPPSTPYGYILPTHPYGGRHANGGDESGNLGQNTVDLTPYIEDAMPGHTLANGSDANPLVLTFTMGSLALGAMQFNNGYMELSLGEPSRWNPVDDPAKAPTDFVLVGGDNGSGCVNCNSTCTGGDTAPSTVSWPTICQQEFPHPLCPPKQTVVRSAVAIGALALLDNNPCHCCVVGYVDPKKPYRRQCVVEDRTPDLPDGWQEPTNVHLSYFDGVEWRVLREGMGGPGSYGDFRYGNYWIYWQNPSTGEVLGNTDSGWETVVLTIKTHTVDIYHKTKMVNQVDGQWVETWVESLAKDLPRRYSGGFNRLRAGTDESCQLNNDTHTCNTAVANGLKKCTVMKRETCDGANAMFRASYVSFDNVNLSGGIGGIEPGACCLSDGTCEDLSAAACQTRGGTFRGSETSCSSDICFGACCMPLHDCIAARVDQCSGVFLGAGTTCGVDQCPCPEPFADVDQDGDVDQSDFAVLQACFTGPGGAGVSVSGLCNCFDRDPADGGDNDVDADDVTAFELCASGPGVPVSPSCGTP